MFSIASSLLLPLADVAGKAGTFRHPEAVLAGAYYDLPNGSISNITWHYFRVLFVNLQEIEATARKKGEGSLEAEARILCRSQAALGMGERAAPKAGGCPARLRPCQDMVGEFGFIIFRKGAK